MSDLDAAYHATSYEVWDGETWLAAWIGRPAPEIQQLLIRFGVHSGSFVTAWNPRSVPHDAEANHAAAARLTADIQARRRLALPHRGRGDDGDWPAEEGWFILDLDETAGRQLAEAYGQNALVHVARGCLPRLVKTGCMQPPGFDRLPGKRHMV